MSGTYDVFREDEQGQPIWVATVTGLDEAKARIAKLACAKPGTYLIFDPARAKFITTYKMSA